MKNLFKNTFTLLTILFAMVAVLYNFKTFTNEFEIDLSGIGIDLKTDIRKMLKSQTIFLTIKHQIMETLTDIQSKTFESEVLIRFGDCDPFNHLNNSKYLEYFMNAREDHLQTGHGLNLVHIAKEKGVGWVVSKHQIAYLSPAHLAETVNIQTTILEWRERGLLLEMRMWNTVKTKPKAIMWAEFVHFDLRSQKSIPHSKDMDKLFKPYENRLDEECLGFESRLTSVGGKSAQEL